MDLGLLVEGSSGVRAIAFSSGTCTPKECMSKFVKAKLESGRIQGNIVIGG